MSCWCFDLKNGKFTGQSGAELRQSRFIKINILRCRLEKLCVGLHDQSLPTALLRGSETGGCCLLRLLRVLRIILCKQGYWFISVNMWHIVLKAGGHCWHNCLLLIKAWCFIQSSSFGEFGSVLVIKLLCRIRNNLFCLMGRWVWLKGRFVFWVTKINCPSRNAKNRWQSLYRHKSSSQRAYAVLFEAEELPSYGMLFLISLCDWWVERIKNLLIILPSQN